VTLQSWTGCEPIFAQHIAGVLQIRGLSVIKLANGWCHWWGTGRQPETLENLLCRLDITFWNSPVMKASATCNTTRKIPARNKSKATARSGWFAARAKELRQ